jgi:hypothetical protein
VILFGVKYSDKEICAFSPPLKVGGVRVIVQ